MFLQKIEYRLFGKWILLLLMLPAMVGAKDFVLAACDEAAACTIVLPATASASQKYAAEELQRFTEQITGVILPVISDSMELPDKAVLLGYTSYTDEVLGEDANLSDLGEEGFRIVSRPDKLLIIGSSKRGTLYGVYELLERFGGCRWYTSWHSLIPEGKSFAVPVGFDETQKPAFALREPFWYDMFDGDLAARNKVNGNAMRLLDRHGGHAYRFGRGLGSCHTFDSLLPVAKYFGTHPEYFSEINGRRTSEQTQLCLTNPEVLAIVTSNVLDRIRKDPEAQFYGVSQNDWDNPCSCASCKAIDEREGAHSGTMLEFVNKIAEEVEKEFPHAIIETLAYRYTRKPPKNIRPAHNVLPCLCTIECDFSKPFNTSRDTENVSFCNDIREWSRISKQLYLWDYTTNFRYYTSPSPNVLALQENVKFFRSHGVKYLFEQGAYQGIHGDFAELKAWLLAKWLWNPDLPLETLLDDFFPGYYGKAAPLVRLYFDELHTFHSAPDVSWRIYEDIVDENIPDSFLEKALLLWQEAEEAVKESPGHLYNVRMGAVPAMQARLARLEPRESKTVWATENPSAHEVPLKNRELAAGLLKRFEEAGKICLSESAALHNSLLEGWRSLALSSVPTVDPPPLVAIIEDRDLSFYKQGILVETVADEQADDGSAARMDNSHYEWCTSFRFAKVAFDSGQRYRIRVRVRVEKTKEAGGEAFWSGVYDSRNKRSCGQIVVESSDVVDGYQWYDVIEWVPEADHYFWIGPGRFDKQSSRENPGIRAVYIDKLELARL